MDVNYISFSPNFFVWLRPELLVWGHSGLPKQIHFTFSNDARSPYANFHVTKENGAEKKPKVTIAETESVVLEAGSFIDPNIFFANFYKPLILTNWRKRRRTTTRNRADYIRLDNLEQNPSAIPLLTELKKTFRAHSRITRKKRLIIDENIVKALENWTQSDIAIDFFLDNLRPVSKYTFTQLEFGYWLSETYSGPVMVIHGYVYKMSENMSPEVFMSCLFDEQTARQLMKKFESAIRIVTEADTYDDTEFADKGVKILGS